MLQVGAPAPAFRTRALRGTEECTITLEQFNDRWLLLCFYTKYGTEVCRSEHAAFRKYANEFERLNTSLVAVSTDTIDAHRRWLEDESEPFPYLLAADPGKDLARLYEVLHEDTGLALRATILVDPDSIVRYVSVCDLGIGRSVQEALRVLQALQTGKMTPCEWNPGEPTL